MCEGGGGGVVLWVMESFEQRSQGRELCWYWSVSVFLASWCAALGLDCICDHGHNDGRGILYEHIDMYLEVRNSQR